MKISAFVLSVLTLFAGPIYAGITLSGAEYVPLLDQPARTCAAQIKDWNDQKNYDLHGITALMGTVRLYWDGPSALFLDSMTISFTGPHIVGGRQDIFLTGEELGYLWSSDNVIPSFTPRSGRAVTPFCRFRVGGLKVSDKHEYFEGIGIITVKGRYQENGEWKTISGGDLTFRYHMTPLPRVLK